MQTSARSLAPGTLRGFLAVVLTAVVVPSTGNAQTTPLDAKLLLRPISRDEISAYKLPSTTQISAGLATVGLGQPAYLEVLIPKNIPAAEVVDVNWTLERRPAESKADLDASPLGADVPAYEPADHEDYRVVGRKLLLPDAGGTYNLKVVVNTAKNGSATKLMMITAGTYVGVGKCVGCHNGGAEKPWSMVGSWAATGHAKIFKDGMNGVASDHYGAGCLACHTVGYDANAKVSNGGFSDVAAQLKWTFPTPKVGTFDVLPEQLKALGGVQCENCHGPGSRHVASGGDPRLISVSTESGVCAQCHGALTHHAKNGEWNNSVHAVTTREAAGTGREGCVGCHTGKGFIDKMNGKTTPRTDYSAINCQACHESHGQMRPDTSKHLVRNSAEVTLRDGTVIKDGGNGSLCMNCHQARQNGEVYAATSAASSRFGPHHSPQADMLRGTNAFTYGKYIPSSAHTAVIEDTCVGCHMQPVEPPSKIQTHAGGHTFKPGAEGDEQLVEACQKCHGRSLGSFNFSLLDYNNDGKIEGVQTEVQHLLDELSALLPPVGKAKSSFTIDSTWTRPQLKAVYNWQFVAYDGSKGVHNMAYAVGLLKASIADLQANPK